ncbi:MAG TPA: hypothetical protein VED01_00405, partial [Burkholderiales bacterium]|nr:hypothetical protein [Burkholderiales bacterium]
MSGVERVRIDTEQNLLDVLDKVQEISPESVDDTHIFTLSQVYEGLLLKMGEKRNDGGQFFTPREVLHGIDQPNLWHGNTLMGQEVYGGLFEHAPGLYDVVLTNPPFGGKES